MPLLTRKCLSQTALCLLLAGFASHLAVPLAFAPPARAAVAENSLEQVATEDVIARAEDATRLVTSIIERRAPRLDHMRETRTALDQLAVQRAAIALPEPGDMSAPPADLAAAEALAERQTRRIEATEQSIALAKDRLARLGDIRTRYLGLADETDLLASAVSSALPLIEELSKRRRDGEAVPASVLSAATNIPDADQLTEESRKWRQEARLAELDADRTRAEMNAATARLETDQAAAKQARRWLQEANARASLLESMAGQSAGALQAEFMSLVADFDHQYQELSGILEQFRRQTAELARAEEALVGLTPPEPAPVSEALDGTGFLARLNETKRAVSLSSAVVEYRQTVWNSLRALRTDIRQTLEHMGGVQGRIEPAVEQAMSLDVLSELLQEQAGPAAAADADTDTPAEEQATEEGLAAEEGVASEKDTLPEEASDNRYTSRLVELREAASFLARQDAALKARLEELEEAIPAARAALVQARHAQTAHRARLTREEEWTRYINELKELDGPELLAAFQEADAAWREGGETMAAFESRVEEQAKALQEILDSISNTVDPVQLLARDNNEAFQAWLADRNLRIDTAPAETVAAEVPAPDSPPAKEAVAAPESEAAGHSDSPAAPAAEQAAETPGKAETWLARMRELRDGTVIRRRAFYEEHSAFRTETLTRINLLHTTLTALDEQSRARLDLARKAWAAAALLRAQAGDGNLVISELPDSLANWTDRTALEDVAALNSRITTLLAEIEGPRQTLEDIRIMDGLVEPLESWGTLLSGQTEQLGDYIRLHAIYGTIDNFEKMDPLRRREIESEIADRIASDLGAEEMLSSYFGSGETQSIDELLTRYYERLIINEKRQENLEKRQEILTGLSEKTQSSREILQKLRENVTGVAELAEKRLTVHTALVRAALDPIRAADILAEVNEKTGLSLSASDLPDLPPGDSDEETLRKARNDLVNSLNNDWTLLAGYQAWIRDLDDRIAPLGRIDQQSEEFRDLAARLAATQGDVKRTVGRLVGYSDAEMERLKTEQTGLDGDQHLLQAGEIGLLRDQRHNALKESAMLTLVTLIVIPVVALAIVILARLAGAVLIRRAAKREEDEPGTTERVRTLNRISQTILTVAAVALSAIYMLQSVNIDVGPLIASLGIFGLAVAFGAQSTLKDVFAGFFLLLEKQLNVGDWVIVNGKVGMVESIDLRLTTIRDWHTGGLNYISNGDISSVMNWCRGNENNPMIGGQKNNSGVGNTWVRFYVTFDSDPDQVVAIFREVAEKFKKDEVHGHKINDIWVDPGINKIHPDSRTFEFRVLLLGNISIWGAGRVYQSRVVKALIAAGISLPEARVKLTDMPPLELPPGNGALFGPGGDSGDAEMP